MTDALEHIALATSGSTDLAIAVKATIILTLALASVMLMGQSRASLRPSCWPPAFAALAVLPAGILLLPPLAGARCTGASLVWLGQLKPGELVPVELQPGESRSATVSFEEFVTGR